MNRTELIGLIQSNYDISPEEMESIENDGEKLIQTIFDMDGFVPPADIRELVDGAFGGNLSGKNLLDSSDAIQIKTSGIINNIAPRNGSDFSLEEMYAFIETDIVEPIYLPGDKVIIADEEGGLKIGREINWVATKIVADAALKIGRQPCFIFGNVMLINQSQIK